MLISKIPKPGIRITVSLLEEILIVIGNFESTVMSKPVEMLIQPMSNWRVSVKLVDFFRILIIYWNEESIFLVRNINVGFYPVFDREDSLYVIFVTVVKKRLTVIPEAFSRGVSKKEDVD